MVTGARKNRLGGQDHISTEELMSVSLRRRALALGLLAAPLAFACSSDPSAPQPKTDAPAARTSLPRALTTAEQDVLAASNAFTFALWRQVNKSQNDTNVFVSPLSASFALGMTLNGAAGTTYDEMHSALQYGHTSLADIDAGYKSLIGLLASIDPSVTMQIANSIWYRNTFPFKQTFLDTGHSSFDATITPLDFTKTAQSLSTINGWVTDKTNGRITSILDRITDDDVMFLINAIYFKANWRSKFDPALTQAAPFHGVGGDQQASLMHKEDKIGYARGTGYQAVDLPYGDSTFTMTVILPDAGTTVESVAASLDANAWASLTNGFRTALVDLALPKLKLEWKRDLIPDLQGLGMHTPFTNSADFTGMSTLGTQLLISSVQQKTFVQVDEEGTQAAAVTSVGITVTSAPVPVAFRVDRPYIFAIRERLSGTVLFMGKIIRMP